MSPSKEPAPVLIFEEAYRNIQREVERCPDVETGGMLYGARSSDGLLLVAYASGSMATVSLGNGPRTPRAFPFQVREMPKRRGRSSTIAITE